MSTPSPAKCFAVMAGITELSGLGGQQCVTLCGMSHMTGKTPPIRVWGMGAFCDIILF